MRFQDHVKRRLLAYDLQVSNISFLKDRISASSGLKIYSANNHLTAFPKTDCSEIFKGISDIQLALPNISSLLSHLRELLIQGTIRSRCSSRVRTPKLHHPWSWEALHQIIPVETWRSICWTVKIFPEEHTKNFLSIKVLRTQESFLQFRTLRLFKAYAPKSWGHFLRIESCLPKI